MDNYNGQNQFQPNQPMQNQFAPNQPMQNQFAPNQPMQNQFAPNQPMQNQFAPNQQYVQPNMYQQPNLVYVKPKSNAWKWVLGIGIAIMAVIGLVVLLFVACTGAIIGSTTSSYVEKSKYTKDIANFDGVYTALKTFVADPKSNYVDGKIYTLSELMESRHDKGDVIEGVIEEALEDDGDFPYTFNCSSEVFEGTTTDDVLVYIENGMVSIYIPVNEKYEDDYDPYLTGSAFNDKR